MNASAEPEPFVYTVARWIASAYFLGLHKIEIHGEERVPREGGFLIAVNHASYYDPPVAGYAIRRTLHFFARRTLLDNPAGAWLFPRLNTIPVDRDGPSDVGALKRVIRVLTSGHGLTVFPEGTRTSDGLLQPAKPGIGLLACRAQVPVVPARVFGSYESYSRHHRLPTIGTRLTLVYGTPLSPADYDPGGRGKERYQIAAERIMQSIAAIETPREVLL